MNRTEKYERGISMTNRIFELETIHRWSELETRTAFAALDEQLPIGLHNIGEFSRSSFRTTNIYICYSFPTCRHASRWTSPPKKVWLSHLHPWHTWLLPPNRTRTWDWRFST